MAADEPDEEPDLDVDEAELDDDALPFSLDDEADVVDAEDEDGGPIDLDAAMAMADAAEGAEEADADEDEDDEDDDEDEVPVKEGEFVCNGCHMVFRVTAMANTKARLCRDCA